MTSSLSDRASALFDALALRFRETRLAADPDCPLCAPGRAFPGYIDYAAFCAGG